MTAGATSLFGSKELVDWTMEHRTHKDAFNHKCWTQDQIQPAIALSSIRARTRPTKRRCTQSGFSKMSVRSMEQLPFCVFLISKTCVMLYATAIQAARTRGRGGFL